MERRSFLVGTGTLLLSQLLASCTVDNQVKLQVQLLENSLPGQVVNQFSKSLKQKTQLKFSPVQQLKDIFLQLRTWQQKNNTTDQEVWRRFIPFAKSKKAPLADLVTLGDYWIGPAIQQQLIQPLEVKHLKNWSTLPERWRSLVTRNDQGLIDPQGNVWAVPYRWGSTVIVYRRDLLEDFDWTPKDWSDLWRSELRSRISLLDQPREVIGLVLKKLGKSYNTTNLSTIADLEKELRTLNQQVKFYSSSRYLEPLIIGDTWLAVGWSHDVLPAILRYPQLAAVIPQSGTAIWSDLWVQPAGNKREDLPYQWLDFCLTANISKDISLLTKTNSPILENLGKTNIQEPLGNLLQSNYDTFKKSEFLLPLPQTASQEYESLFAKIKQEVNS
jgi:putative spermidine/putrescine transport system substrate-binding protein